MTEAEPGELTSRELTVLHHLGQAWNAWLLIPQLDQDDLDEFRYKIHDLQRMVSHKAASRANPEELRP